jgi:heptose I phosphotransferase
MKPPVGYEADRDMVGHDRPCDRHRDTFWQRLSRGVRRLYQRPDWVELLGVERARQVMGLPVTDRFHAKQGRSTGRLILEGNGQRLVVYLKRHYRLGWWRGLLATLWPDAGWSPALEEYAHLAWARRRGVPVPATVAAGEYIGPWARLQSFLAIEELTDMLPLHEAIPAAAALLGPERFRPWKRGLIAEVARLTREIHTHRRFHKDLYLCHFFVARADFFRMARWEGRVWLIDLHRLAHHPWTRRWWQVKDLAQLLYSSELEGIDARDRLRFWKGYLGDDRRTWSGHWLRRWVLFRWRRYRRHNTKKSP